MYAFGYCCVIRSEKKAQMFLGLQWFMFSSGTSYQPETAFAPCMVMQMWFNLPLSNYQPGFHGNDYESLALRDIFPLCFPTQSTASSAQTNAWPLSSKREANAAVLLCAGAKLKSSVIHHPSMHALWRGIWKSVSVCLIWDFIDWVRCAN